MARSLMNLPYAHALHQPVAHSFEARCAWLLEPKLPCFVLGAEGASVDCGLVVTHNGQPLEQETTHRLFKTLKEYRGEERLLPIEIKTFSPHPCSSFKGGRYAYNFATQPLQKTCVAFIVQNAAAPHLVALIPRHYLTRHASSSKKHLGYYGREVNYSSLVMESFPMEWSPFVMPFETLPDALESLLMSYHDPSHSWRNPHNGIIFDDCPRPTLHAVDLLRPEDSSRLRDYAVIEDIWNAFETHSSKYRVERMTIQPSVGDFQIIHKDSNRRSVIELKQTLASTTQRGELVYVSHRIAQRTGRRIPFFSPLTPWDFLLTSLRGDPTRMVLVSRDDLPSRWFEELPPGNDRLLRWTPDRGFLKDHTLVWRPQETFVRQMERTLDRYASQDRLNARKTRPFRSIAEKGLVALPEDESDVEIERDTLPVVSRRLRGNGRQWSRGLWETSQEDWLTRQCEKHQCGAVYRLGRHLSSSHVFTLLPRNENTPTSFFDLDLHTPMIYLNFAPMESLDLLVPTDMRRPRSFLHATHGLSKSMYLINAVPPSLDWLPHSRCLVPSSTLCVPGRFDVNEKIIHDAPCTQPARPILLSQNELIDVYAISDDDVLPQLRRIFEQPLCVDRIRMGDVETAAGVEIELKDYLTTKGAVMQQYLAVLLGNSFYDNRGGDDDDDDV